MKFLITGGAGFIGSHLIEHLLANGHSTICIDNLSTGSRENIERFFSSPSFKFIHDDVETPGLLESYVPQVDIVFHLAACVGVQNVVRDPIHCIETNLAGTAAALRSAARHVKRIFTFSTSEVYGKSTKFPFCENDDIVLGPVHKLRWSYAASKLVDDYLAKAYYAHRNTAVTIVRLFNTIGRGQVGHYGMVVPRFFEQALNQKPLTVYGNGRQSRCFTDVRDVVSTLVALIPEKRSYGELVNIGSGEEISILDLARLIKEITRSASPIEMVSFEAAYGRDFEDMDRRVPSIEKLYQLTPYRFRHNLRSTLDWVHQGMVVSSRTSAPVSSRMPEAEP